MIFRESLRMAAGSLWSHKTRSILTILGVIIGVSSVLAVVTLGKSFEASVVGQFDDVDNRAVFVSETLKEGANRGPPNAGNFGPVFTKVDVDHLTAMDHVQRVIPNGDVQATALLYEGKTYVFRTLKATVAESDTVKPRDDKALYSSGTVFADGKSQVVLGFNVAEGLGNLTGKPVNPGAALTLRFPDGSQRDATVVGVLAKSDSLFGQSNDNVYVPLDPFYQATIQSPSSGKIVPVYSGLSLRADSARNTNAVRDAAKAYFAGTGSDAKALLPPQVIVQVATQGDIVGAISAVFDQVTLFISAIAVVSLIVGAIGIANIMLVSVTERTREIGVMKAIGAKNGEILRLFLLESILIGVVGSVIGLALGLGLGAFVVSVVFSASKTAVVLPYEWIGISLLVGTLVGVVAGYLPARRATRIQPIQALAYE